jgi:hypothetical protein
MEIIINGPGEVLVCFVDRQGKVLLQERSRISGSDAVFTRRPVSLSMETRNGHVDVSPVLMSHGSKQRVTFDGQEAAKFTMGRCKDIGCTEALLRDVAERRLELLPAQHGHTPTQRLPERPPDRDGSHPRRA